MKIRDNPRIVEELRQIASQIQDQEYARSLQENEDVRDRIKSTICNTHFLWLCFIVFTAIGLPLILSCILKG